jgi:hypothetical protein
MLLLMRVLDFRGGTLCVCLSNVLCVSSVLCVFQLLAGVSELCVFQLLARENDTFNACNSTGGDHSLKRSRLPYSRGCLPPAQLAHDVLRHRLYVS